MLKHFTRFRKPIDWGICASVVSALTGLVVAVTKLVGALHGTVI